MPDPPSTSTAPSAQPYRDGPPSRPAGTTNCSPSPSLSPSSSSSSSNTAPPPPGVPASQPKPKPRPESDLARIASLIKSGKARDIVVLTGAGISTSAGIPDFRSPETGLYANLASLNLPFPEAVFELNYFKRNPKPFWTLARDLYPGKYIPTPAHYFLRLLHSHRLLRRVFTQNIDTLESLAGLPDSHLIEAHGSFATAHCLSCGKEASREYVLRSGVREGKVVKCDAEGCWGLVKPDIVFFGEGLPDRFFHSLGDLKKCDLLIIIGTSLQVHPFASLPSSVPASTPRLLINREAVGPFARLASSRSTGPEGGLSKLLASLYDAEEQDETRSRDVFWGGEADDGVRRLADELGWTDELEEAIRSGREELRRKWGEIEGEETPVLQAEDQYVGAGGKDRAEKVAKDVKEAAGGDVPTKPAATGKNDGMSELNDLIEKQLHLTEDRED